MAMKRFKTNFPGVRYKEHPTRKHGIKHDRYFSIYYYINGKKREEGLGWASQGWTVQKAASELSKLKESHRLGQGPQTLKEKREIEYEKRAQKEKDSITFDTLFYEIYLPQQKTKKTWQKEVELYRLWIESVIGNLFIKDISPLHIERIKKNMDKKAASTIRYCLGIARQVLNYAYRIGLYNADNPVRKVKMPKADNKRIRFLTHEEADKLLKALYLKSPEVRDMALLALQCGLRAGEIFNLTWGDIDIERGILLLSDTKSSMSGRIRYAYLPTETKEMLSIKQRGNKDDLVFKGRGGIKRRFTSKTYDRVVKDLGLNDGVTDPRQKVVFHSLRHTYASWLVESGVDLYTVKTLLGHSSIVMTERYSHLGQNTLQNAVRTFEKSLNPPKDKVVEMKK